MKSMPESYLLDKYNLTQQILNRAIRAEISGKRKKMEPVSNSYFQDVKLGALRYLRRIVSIFSIWKKNETISIHLNAPWRCHYWYILVFVIRKTAPDSLCLQFGAFLEPGRLAANTERGSRAGWVDQSWTLIPEAHLSYTISPLRDLRPNLSVLLVRWGEYEQCYPRGWSSDERSMLSGLKHAWHRIHST